MEKKKQTRKISRSRIIQFLILFFVNSLHEMNKRMYEEKSHRNLKIIFKVLIMFYDHDLSNSYKFKRLKIFDTILNYLLISFIEIFNFLEERTKIRRKRIKKATFSSASEKEEWMSQVLFSDY